VIRVLLVDDHLAFREPLAFMLARERDMTVVGQAGTVEGARDCLNELDVAVVDLALDGGNGLDLVRDIRQVCPAAAILILTASNEPIDHARAIEAGAAGILHKSSSIVEIIAAVRRLAAGEKLYDVGEVIELFRLLGQQREQDRAAQEIAASLTPREREVLQALAPGRSDREIADELHIAVETVRTHMVNIYRKLGVDSRTDALLVAARYGMVKLG